ncbi:hypothetical protein PBY51_013723 [Eleginops maclovinus]|uniref:Uncharacterized protein n=1 Tax=Eleginops maclovinus TaxID=56733 RepID=A0AAN7Y858_ELEMC|nr:hypothetical protein PBY51_013723 [Eleginops maclovinus]
MRLGERGSVVFSTRFLRCAPRTSIFFRPPGSLSSRERSGGGEAVTERGARETGKEAESQCWEAIHGFLPGTHT